MAQKVTILKKSWSWPQTFEVSSAAEANRLKRDEAESYRDIQRLIELDIADWYTISPKHRTKDQLLEMIRTSCKWCKR
jgi:hypothetical protein